MSEQIEELDPAVASEETAEAYMLDRKAVAAILETVEANDQAHLTQLMEPLHAADIADLLEQIDEDDRAALIRLYGQEFDGEILSELDESIREEVISILTRWRKPTGSPLNRR